MRSTVGVLVLGLVFISSNAAAWRYDVGRDYDATHSFDALDLFQNRYEITASSGQVISYRVIVLDEECASVYLFRGHVLEVLPQYGDYISGYSQWRCVSEFGNEFPVGQGDGRAFTLVVHNDRFREASYHITVHVRDGPAIIAGFTFSMILVTVLVVVVLAILRKWRRRPKPPL